MRALKWATLAAGFLSTALAGVSIGAPAADGAAPLTAAQILQKNVDARGGLDAWRKVQTMVWVGHLVTDSGSSSSMPFSLEQKRPNKTRFEIDAGGQKTLRVFDGTRGWKSRPGRDGGRDVQPYTAQEIKFALDAQGMDGPLIDYEAKGNSVALEGVEDIEGTRSYRLSVRLASGQMQKVWIDAQTFLDLRYDRMNYNVAGAPGTVSVFYGDYRNVDGVQIPATRVIGLGSGKTPDRMQLERITVNAPMNDRLFAQPAANKRHGAGAFGSNAAPSGNPAMSVSGSNPDPASAPR